MEFDQPTDQLNDQRMERASCRGELAHIEKQAQDGNSHVRLEMTNKMLRNVEMLRNVKKCLKMLLNVKRY